MAGRAITISRPDKKMTEFKSDGTGKKLLKNPYYSERMGGTLKVLQLCTGVAVTKDYGPYDMSYNRLGGFRKYLKEEGRSVEPSKDEIFHFKRDINRAAYYGDTAMRGFLEMHADLKLETWQM